jgi:hypothetical protein
VSEKLYKKGVFFYLNEIQSLFDFGKLIKVKIKNRCKYKKKANKSLFYFLFRDKNFWICETEKIVDKTKM